MGSLQGARATAGRLAFGRRLEAGKGTRGMEVTGARRRHYGDDSCVDVSKLSVSCACIEPVVLLPLKQRHAERDAAERPTALDDAAATGRQWQPQERRKSLAEGCKRPLSHGKHGNGQLVVRTRGLRRELDRRERLRRSRPCQWFSIRVPRVHVPSQPQRLCWCTVMDACHRRRGVHMQPVAHHRSCLATTTALPDSLHPRRARCAEDRSARLRLA
jgi:hypothetical protein